MSREAIFPLPIQVLLRATWSLRCRLVQIRLTIPHPIQPIIPRLPIPYPRIPSSADLCTCSRTSSIAQSEILQSSSYIFAFLCRVRAEAYHRLALGVLPLLMLRFLFWADIHFCQRWRVGPMHTACILVTPRLPLCTPVTRMAEVIARHEPSRPSFGMPSVLCSRYADMSDNLAVFVIRRG